MTLSNEFCAYSNAVSYRPRGAGVEVVCRKETSSWRDAQATGNVCGSSAAHHPSFARQASV